MEFWQSISFTETEQLVAVSRRAEEVGFTGVAISEHLVTPQTIASKYPYTDDGTVWWDPEAHWPDPWAMVSALATHTSTLRFITNVYVLPMHDVFSAAKAISTAAYLSGNRATLGVGVGWMKDEFLLTGQDFHVRGRRMDEMLEVIALLLGGGMVEYHGRYIDFPPVQMSPVPSEPVPVYIGGESEPALRRAARSDGWFGGGPYHPDELVVHLKRLAAHCREAGRELSDIGTITGLSVPPDIDLYRRLRHEGLGGIVVPPLYYSGTPTSSVDVKLDALERFAETIIAPLTD